MKYAMVVGLAVGFGAHAMAQVTRLVPDEFPSIQSAIAASKDGDTVLVAPGVYAEVIDFGGRAITVRSVDGPELTTIEKPFGAGNGVPGGQPSSPVVIFEHGEGRDSVLEGFTITKGTGRFSSLWACDCDGYQLGGGLLIVGASPVVRDCIVRGNTCFTYFSRGGGVYAEGGSPRFEHCRFLENGAGGGYGRGGGAWIAGDAEFFDCHFQLNASNSYHFGHGGGVWVEGGAPLLDAVRIVRNQASHGIGALRVTPTTRMRRTYVGAGNAPTTEGTPVDLGGNVVDGDCDGNGVSDEVEIASDASLDADGDGVPDHCACLFAATPCCPGDFNGDGAVSAGDFAVLLTAWGTAGDDGTDLDGDGVVNAQDVAALLAAWGACG